jgi:dipeptidyl aminopeptidase/acylaminoacyl peptidase
MKFSVPLFLAGAVLSLSLHAAPPELPLETFFSDPQASQVQLSPDGHYLALLSPANNRMQIVVVDRKAGKRHRLTNMAEESVVSVWWAKDSRLVFHQQVKGQESLGTYAIDANGGNLKVLQQAADVEDDHINNADDRRGFSLVGNLPDDPDNILVNVIRGRSGLGDVYKLNVRTEKRTLIMSNLGKVREWIADRAGAVRIALSRDEHEHSTTILYRSSEQAEWQEIHRVPSAEIEWRPLAFDGDNKTLILATNEGRSTTGLFTYDPEQRKITGTLIDDPRYDVDASLVYSHKRHRVVGARYEGEKHRTVWFEPEFQQIQAGIDQALPHTLNSIVSFTRDETEFVAVARSDRDPGTYYLYDARDRTLRELIRRSPGIDPAQMAEMRPITYAARDGMQLFGYLTLPNGREAHGLPLIVLPHGGPYGPRDTWGFEPEVQFLANRGYAVLQVNFRGSGGYGHAYEAAGYRQWGRAMQDDLTDGVNWAVRSGFADASRVAIYGASYGGYAALAGLTFTPELYVCGVNYVGVVDIERLGVMLSFNYLPKPTQDYLARRFLHPLKDAKQIHDISPIHFIENIRVPVLNAYGKHDPRVTKDHGQVLEEALKKHRKNYKSILVENEGHGFGKYENRMAFFREMDRFFAQYLRPTQKP